MRSSLGSCKATCQLAGRYFPYRTPYPSSGMHSLSGKDSERTRSWAGVPANKIVAPCRSSSFPTGIILVVCPRPQSRGASNIRCGVFTHKDTKKKERLSGQTASNSGVSSSRFGWCQEKIIGLISLGLADLEGILCKFLYRSTDSEICCSLTLIKKIFANIPKRHSRNGL